MYSKCLEYILRNSQFVLTYDMLIPLQSFTEEFVYTESLISKGEPYAFQIF